MSDKEIYQLIADELKTKQVDSALWTQAKEAALGDPDKAEAIYIRLRFVELVKSPPILGSGALVSLPAPVPRELKELNELSHIRRELTTQLANHKKHNLYSILKVSPDADDAAIAKAISDLELNEQASSGIHPSELKYAKETLGNASLRAQYDGQLLESLSNRMSIGNRSYEALNEEEYAPSWWESRKASFIIGVFSLSIMGYLGTNYLKEKNSHEIQQQAIDSQKAALQSIANAAQARAQAEVDLRGDASRFVAERQSQEMELRNRTADRMREEQRQLQESRMLAEQQQKEAQQARETAQQTQAEDLRIRREKQYWSCMNMQLSQQNISSYEASARCTAYR